MNKIIIRDSTNGKIISTTQVNDPWDAVNLYARLYTTNLDNDVTIDLVANNGYLIETRRCN